MLSYEKGTRPNHYHPAIPFNEIYADTDDGEQILIATLEDGNNAYYGKLFENAEAMLQICRDLNAMNNTDHSKLEGIINRARSVVRAIDGVL